MEGWSMDAQRRASRESKFRKVRFWEVNAGLQTCQMLNTCALARYTFRGAEGVWGVDKTFVISKFSDSGFRNEMFCFHSNY